MVVRSSFFLLFLSENRPFFLHAAEGLRGLQFLKGRALLLFLLFSLSRAHAVASIETTFSLVLLLLLLGRDSATSANFLGEVYGIAPVVCSNIDDV